MRTLPKHSRYAVRTVLYAPVLLVLLLASDARSDRAAPLEGNPLGTLLGERFTMGRLAGQQAWQPCRPAGASELVPRVRCGEPLQPGTPRFLRVARAEQSAGSALRSGSSPAVLRLSALFKLRWQTLPPNLDSAVTSLEQARRLAPRDPAILNDLAVALLALGERKQELMPMLRALDAVEQAVALDSLLVSALFNRALIRQRLYLTKSAERAWVEYLATERHPGWRSEAQAHVRQLERERGEDAPPWQIRGAQARGSDETARELASRVRHAPGSAREFCFTLLSEWGLAVEQGNHERAAQLLAQVREMARALDATGADRSVALAIRSIDASPGDASMLRALARAHVTFGKGHASFGQAQYEQAADSLQRAESALRELGSPLARWAAFYYAASEVNLARYTSADQRFQRLLTEITAEEPGLRGKAIWALGVSQLRRGRYEQANRFYSDALPHIVRAREPENEGAIAYLLAEGLGRAGQTARGRAEAYRGLRLLAPYRRSSYLNNHLTTVAAYARAEGLLHASSSVMNEALEVARAVGEADVLAWAFRARARERIALGQAENARSDLDTAMLWANRLKPGLGRDRVRADVALIRARLDRERMSGTTLSLLTTIVATYQRVNIDPHTAAAQSETALTALAIGDTALARRHLADAISILERQQESFNSVELRTSHFETVENVFDTMIGVELQAGRAASAFRYMERGRAAAWPRGDRTAPPEIDAIGRWLPQDVLFVEYALRPGQLVVWTASRRGWRQRTLAVPRDALAAQIERLAEELPGDETAAAGARNRLFDLLVRPLGRDLDGIRRLIIVPDRELNRVPFAALQNHPSGHFLVEDYQVTMAPSAAFVVAALSRPPRRTNAAPSALVVGEPALRAGSSPELPPLPGAGAEAERIARRYGRVRLLTGAEARRDSVLALLPRYSVFHFAGHAVFDQEEPGRSYLALAPGGDEESGLLRAWEIGELRLSTLDVVVLSACSTSNPRPSRAGATTGLAYSFLRAGAPATVSTLWDVDDELTTELLAEFHRRYAGGTPAPEALRQAQLQALRSARREMRSPEAWAAFIYTGP